MPEHPCRLCINRCSTFIASQYNLEWVAAWIADAPVPVCYHYKEHFAQAVRA